MKTTSWQRIASTTTGGKPYFLTGTRNGVRYWITWCRHRACFAVTADSIGYPELATFARADTAREYVESL